MLISDLSSSIFDRRKITTVTDLLKATARAQFAEVLLKFFYLGNIHQLNYGSLKRVLKGGTVTKSVIQNSSAGDIQVLRKCPRCPYVESGDMDREVFPMPQMRKYVSVIVYCLEQHSAESSNDSILSDTEGHKNMVGLVLRLYSTYSRLFCTNMYGDLDTRNWRNSLLPRDFLQTFKRQHMLEQKNRCVYSRRHQDVITSNMFHLDMHAKIPGAIIVRNIVAPNHIFGQMIRNLGAEDVWTSWDFKRLLKKTVEQEAEIFPMALVMNDANAYYQYRWSEVVPDTGATTLSSATSHSNSKSAFDTTTYSAKSKFPSVSSCSSCSSLSRTAVQLSPSPSTSVCALPEIVVCNRTANTTKTEGTQTDLQIGIDRLFMPPPPNPDGISVLCRSRKRFKLIGGNTRYDKDRGQEGEKETTEMSVAAETSASREPITTTATVIEPPTTATEGPSSDGPINIFKKKPRDTDEPPKLSFLQQLDEIDAAMPKKTPPAPPQRPPLPGPSTGRTKFCYAMDKALVKFAGKHISNLRGNTIYEKCVREVAELKNCKALGLKRRLVTLTKKGELSTYTDKATALHIEKALKNLS